MRLPAVCQHYSEREARYGQLANLHNRQAHPSECMAWLWLDDSFVIQRTKDTDRREDGIVEPEKVRRVLAPKHGGLE